MKRLYTLILPLTILAVSGCKPKQTQAFMPGCFRNEETVSIYQVPGLSNQTIADAVEYCIEYGALGLQNQNGTYEEADTEIFCTIKNLQNPEFAQQLQHNIATPAFWDIKNRDLILKRIKRKGVIDCSCNIENGTVTVRYKNSYQRKMNFEKIIAQIGLQANARPARAIAGSK